jgi:hypothetical protein
MLKEKNVTAFDGDGGGKTVVVCMIHCFAGHPIRRSLTLAM